MTDVGFDPLGTLDQLKAAGFAEEQARALTDRLQVASRLRQGEAATKSDIAEVRKEISELKSELLKALADQQRWTIGIMAVLFGLMFAGLRLTGSA